MVTLLVLPILPAFLSLPKPIGVVNYFRLVGIPNAYGQVDLSLMRTDTAKVRVCLSTLTAIGQERTGQVLR